MQQCKQNGKCPFQRHSNNLLELLCPFSATCDTGSRERIVEHREIENGRQLFRAGEEFRGIYVLQSGAFKEIADMQDKQQIVDFRYPGDVLGISAICRGRYSYTAQALGKSRVCFIDSEAIQELVPHREIISAISHRLRCVQLASVMLRQQNAEQRIIHFIIDIALSLGFNPQHKIRLRLPMPRRDIANYLGLVVETVSRVLQRLQADGLISTRGRTLELLDCPQLTRRLLINPVPWL